jgi:hypothetical protein
MEIISSLDQNKRYYCEIEIYPYLRDHHLEGKVILPAVESLIVLAKAVKSNYPQMELNCLLNASFSRFLTISPDTLNLPVIVDMKNSDDSGSIKAFLSTSIKSKTGDIRRTVEHACVAFVAEDSSGLLPNPSLEVNKPGRSCFSVPSTDVYSELVTFGKAYQNIIGDLSISAESAHTVVSGGNYEADEDLLGSPFPLDAVLHMACVWGQRFAGIVSFPVGFEKRIIYQKTKKGENYVGHVVPVSINKNMLIFDAWIYKDGVICESISGIQMKDVSEGSLTPPQWIRA